MQKFLSLEANYDKHTEEEKTSTELEASGENPIQSALSDDSDDEAIISSDEEEDAHALQNIAHPSSESPGPGSSNDCSNMVNSEAEADSKQSFKKLESTKRGLKELTMKKNLDYVEKNNGTLAVERSTKICLTGGKTKHACVMSELRKGRNTHTKRAKKVKEVHIKEITQPEKWINSYKIPKLEKPAKLGHPSLPNLGKWDQEITKMHRNKVVRKKISSQTTATRNGEKMRGAPQLKGILRKKGHLCKKAKAVRWQTPLDKVIWISRNRNFQDSWHVSFAKKISVSKNIV